MRLSNFWRNFGRQEATDQPQVEDWNVTFEAIGFKNAILCRDAPTAEEDASWDPEDARYSVIRWVAFKMENAMGPHVHDPRSGEIISTKMVL